MKHRQPNQVGTMACKRFCLVWVVLAMGMTLFAFAVFAQDLIRPEMVFPDHYPEGFHGVGIITRIEDGFVMIDDYFRFRFSRNVEFYTPTERRTGRNRFSEEDRVGYLLNEEKEIRALYKLE